MPIMHSIEHITPGRCLRGVVQKKRARASDGREQLAVPIASLALPTVDRSIVEALQLGADRVLPFVPCRYSESLSIAMGVYQADEDIDLSIARIAHDMFFGNLMHVSARASADTLCANPKALRSTKRQLSAAIVSCGVMARAAFESSVVRMSVVDKRIKLLL